MSNIEDIKFIEEMIKEYKTFGDLHNPDYEDTDRIYKALENVLERIKELEEKYKKSYQFKSQGRYRIADQHHLDKLLERRNTLVNVLNFDYTGDIKYLEELL